MTIQLTQACRIGGVEQPVGTQLTLDRAEEQSLITRKMAIDLTPVANDVDVKAKINTFIGGCDFFTGNSRVGKNSSNRMPIASHKAFSGAGTALAAGNTVITQQPAEAAFRGVRLIYQNFATSAYTVSGAKVAAAPTHQNDGSALTWKVADVSAAIPAASGSGNDIVTGFMKTPVIALASVARSDGGAFPLAQTRSYFGNAGALQSGVGANHFTDFKAATGREFAARIPAGDLVTTLTPSAPLEAGTWLTPAAIEFIYDVPSVTVAAVGDSLMRGQGSAASALGPVQQFCYSKSSSNFVVSPSVYAVSGQTTGASHAIGASVAATLKPSFLVFSAYSPNDTIATQDDIDALWLSTLSLIQTCLDNKVVPVVVTAVPENALTVGRNNLRLAQNSRVRKLTGHVAVADFDAVIRSTTNSAVIAAFADSGDGRHLSTAGYAAEADVLSGVIPGWI